MSGSYGVLNQKYNTLLAQVLSGGSGGGGGGGLDQVLINGNTTTQTAIFNNASAGSSTTILSNGGVGISFGPAINTVTVLGMAVISGIEQASYEADGMEYVVTVAGIQTDKTIIDDKVTIQKITAGVVTQTNEMTYNTTTLLNGVRRIKLDNTGATPNLRIDTDTTVASKHSILDQDSLLFQSANALLAPTGISVVGINGLAINTGGTLQFLDLGGSAGQVLTYSGGNAVWATAGGGTTIQRGETAVTSMNSTSGTVTYGSVFATKPYVVVSFNNNGVATFIPIGVLSHQQNASLQYTGFTWASASTSATATITWYATI
jgi:hypothetical protein